MGNTSFEELEEEEHFLDPNLLLPDNVTREQLYAEHMASLQAVRAEFGHHIGNGQVNGGIHHHFPPQATTSTFGSYSRSQHMLNGASAVKEEYPSLHAFGYSFGGLPHSDPQDDTDGLKLKATTLLDPTLASLAEDNHTDFINISHSDESAGVDVKDCDDLDFNEWLHDHDETTDESKDTITIENPRKNKLA
jgi:hypothetical protein